MYFVYMIPLETDVLRKHRFQKPTKILTNKEVSCLILSAVVCNMLINVKMPNFVVI